MTKRKPARLDTGNRASPSPSAGESPPAPGKLHSDGKGARGKRETVSGRRRADGAAALHQQLQVLRETISETLEGVSLRLQSEVAEMQRLLAGEVHPGERRPVLPSARAAGILMARIRALKVRPRKGRAKDVVRLEKLVAGLVDHFPREL